MNVRRHICKPASTKSIPQRTSGEFEDDAECGLDLVVLRGDSALVVYDDEAGGVAVLARLEVEEQVAAQPAPSLHRY